MGEVSFTKWPIVNVFQKSPFFNWTWLIHAKGAWSKKDQAFAEWVLFLRLKRGQTTCCNIYFTHPSPLCTQSTPSPTPETLSSGSGSKSGWPWISPNRPPSSIHSSPMFMANKSLKIWSSSLRRLWRIFCHIWIFSEYLSEVCSEGSVEISSRAMRLAKKIAGVQDVLTGLLIITSHPNGHPCWR